MSLPFTMASMTSNLPGGAGRLLQRRVLTLIDSHSSPYDLIRRQWAIPLLPTISLSLPVAIHLNIPSFLPGLWESILRAVPKKKTSHMKKRHRQMAGKALKDVTALNKCSACGNIKRAHLLCPYCVECKVSAEFLTLC